jgi:transcriptional regulator with XRE-family HTH domain
METQTTVSERIKILLNHYGLSQSNLSERCGINNTNLSKILNGGVEPHKSTLKRIVESFPDVNPVWFYSGEGEKFKETKQAFKQSPSIVELLKEENAYLRRQLETVNRALDNIGLSFQQHMKQANFNEAVEIANNEECKQFDLFPFPLPQRLGLVG